MKLLIDIGNTRIKWALLDRGSLLGADAVEHRADAAAVDLMLERISLNGAIAPTDVVAANVAGDVLGKRVTGAVRDRWGLSVRFAVTQLRTGTVRNSYDDYRQLGVDRWLAIIAAADQFAGPVCIVDAGTAITIDVVAPGGVHTGGYIIPGLDLMRQSLGENTGDLRRLAGDGSPQLPTGLPVPGRSTSEAISGGTLAVICCLIDRCVSGSAEHGGDLQVVVTGGDAERLIRHLEGIVHHRPHLVLEGLALYEFERDSGRAGKE